MRVRARVAVVSLASATAAATSPAIAAPPAGTAPVVVASPSAPIDPDASPSVGGTPSSGAIDPSQPGEAATRQDVRSLYDFRLPASPPEPGKRSAGAAATLRSRLLHQTVVPEPSTWALMILGFGAIGAAMRRRRRRGAAHGSR